MTVTATEGRICETHCFGVAGTSGTRMAMTNGIWAVLGGGKGGGAEQHGQLRGG